MLCVFVYRVYDGKPPGRSALSKFPYPISALALQNGLIRFVEGQG